MEEEAGEGLLVGLEGRSSWKVLTVEMRTTEDTAEVVEKWCEDHGGWRRAKVERRTAAMTVEDP